MNEHPAADGAVRRPFQKRVNGQDASETDKHVSSISIFEHLWHGALRKVDRFLWSTTRTRTACFSRKRMQGTPESGWILLDYGDIIVHVMTPKSRSYYDLDTFWGNGEAVDLAAVIKPNVIETEQESVAEEVVSAFLLRAKCPIKLATSIQVACKPIHLQVGAGCCRFLCNGGGGRGGRLARGRKLASN